MPAYLPGFTDGRRIVGSALRSLACPQPSAHSTTRCGGTRNSNPLTIAADSPQNRVDGVQNDTKLPSVFLACLAKERIMLLPAWWGWGLRPRPASRSTTFSQLEQNVGKKRFSLACVDVNRTGGSTPEIHDPPRLHAHNTTKKIVAAHETFMCDRSKT